MGGGVGHRATTGRAALPLSLATLLESATVAVGRLDGVSTLLPDKDPLGLERTEVRLWV